MRQPIVLAALIMLTACGSQDEAPVTPEEAASLAAAAAAAASAAAPDAAAPQVEAVTLSASDKGRVCRAAIASLNGRDPAIIRVIATTDDIYRVRYTRDDGTVWTNECRVGSSTAAWRMVDNGQPGRWRNEDVIRFTVDGGTINIQTFMYGEAVTNDTYVVD